MRSAKILVFAISLCLPAWASAGIYEMRFRLKPDAANAASCATLNRGLGGLHTVTVENDDVIVTSAGGIEGRLKQVGANTYRMAFELEGRRLDAVATLDQPHKTLVVTEPDRRCRWFGQAQEVGD